MTTETPFRHPTLPSDAEFERMKRALDARLGDENHGSRARRPAGSRRSRTVRNVSIAATIAAAATLIVTDMVGLAGWRGGADAAAADILTRAAAEVSFIDANLSPGEYTLVSTQSVNLTSGQATHNGPVYEYYMREYSDLYVPFDRADEWVWVRPPSTVERVVTAGAEDLVQQEFDAREREWGTEPERLRAPGGAFYGNAGSGWGDTANLPRDPYRLLNHIYRTTLGRGQSPDGEALVFIADTLRQGTTPADLRSALLEAAKLIPGVTITDQQANLDGEIGVAVGRLEEVSGIRQELIFDPETGRLIGERQVIVEEDPTGLRAGEVFQWSSIDTTIVSSAPPGGTPNGAFDVMGCLKTGNGTFQCPVPKE